MAAKTLMINRAPVLTLWAAVVAERLGFDRDAALSLGKALAGLNAQSKGRSLGIYHPKPDSAEARSSKRGKGDEFRVELFGRPVPATETEGGLRAIIKGQVIDPDGVERYLRGKFGDDLPTVRKAMERLAGAVEPEDLAVRAMGLYEQFRPEIPSGKRGWGAMGELDLGLIRSLASHGSGA